jgi:hypothetical protein
MVADPAHGGGCGSDVASARRAAGAESSTADPLHVEMGDGRQVDRPATLPAGEVRAAELIAAGAGRRRLAATAPRGRGDGTNLHRRPPPPAAARARALPDDGSPVGAVGRCSN